MEQQQNSFKLLDELAFQEARDRDDDTEPRPAFGQPPARIYRELQGTFSTYRLLGQLVEVFLPRMVDTVICLTGGLPSEHDDDTPEPPALLAPDVPTRPTGPLGDGGGPR